LTRTATYGSWFNFYLCSFGGSLMLPGNIPLHVQTAPATSRCQ
jgi:phospholipid/cholesterol/gamma-HCH transport system substrate-binding protein